MNITQNQLWTIIGIVGLFVFGETAVAFKQAGITASSLNAFFSELDASEALAIGGVGISSIGGYFAGKMRESHLIRKLTEAPKVG